jgi:NTP pyrophosphatase (non-canonical NTP hydrolase)
MDETQATITEWGWATFGEHHPTSLAARMNVEVAELLRELAGASKDHLLAHLSDTLVAAAEAFCARANQLQGSRALGHVSLQRVERAADECADNLVMLTQVASALGVDLQKRTNRKMKVNRARSWAVRPDGRHQHV